MESRIGCGVACLTMGCVERHMLQQFRGTSPILFKRYIDDILGIFIGNRTDLDAFIAQVCSYQPGITFTYDISTTELAFLDFDIDGEDVFSDTIS